MKCTCRSFPDRVCYCHLPGMMAHPEACSCVCEADSPTRPGVHRAPVDIGAAHLYEDIRGTGLRSNR